MRTTRRSTRTELWLLINLKDYLGGRLREVPHVHVCWRSR